LLFCIPVLLIAAVVLFSNYYGGKRTLEEQAGNAAIQTNAVILAGLEHSMIMNDHSMMGSILNATSENSSINRIWVIDPNGVVQLSSNPDEAQTQLDTSAMGCVECHAYPSESRPQAQKIPGLSGLVRVVTPINNDPECVACHKTDQKHLGILLTDISVQELEKGQVSQLQRNLLLALGLIVFGVLLALVVTNLLIVRRVQVMQRAMRAFEDGDYSVRIGQNWRTDDELTRLAATFNQMVASIAQHEQEQQKITQVRQQAMVDEQERIARELHDGVSQFLGYLNTKIMAISKLLDKGEIASAQRQIEQINQAVQLQSVDVRAAIIGLKLAERSGEEFSASLKEYVRQYNRLADLPVDLTIDPSAEHIQLQPEVHLHLVRIVQEAISNIRKHAQAKNARVTLKKVADTLLLTIHDDGVGFNPWEWNIDHMQHFGLQSMRERAELAGAEFSLVSTPGAGTTVNVQLRLEDT
jgi:signal transduction histidine kinase